MPSLIRELFSELRDHEIEDLVKFALAYINESVADTPFAGAFQILAPQPPDVNGALLRMGSLGFCQFVGRLQEMHSYDQYDADQVQLTACLLQDDLVKRHSCATADVAQGKQIAKSLEETRKAVEETQRRLKRGCRISSQGQKRYIRRLEYRLTRIERAQSETLLRNQRLKDTLEDALKHRPPHITAMQPDAEGGAEEQNTKLPDWLGLPKLTDLENMKIESCDGPGHSHEEEFSLLDSDTEDEDEDEDKADAVMELGKTS